MPPADERDREELADLLADLEATLTELRSELRTDPGAVDRQPERRDSRDATDSRPASDRRSGSASPTPPSVSELLRFTEEYTLPTLISTLEAGIRALELLRGTLRLVDGRPAVKRDRRGRSSASRLGDGVAGVGREAVSGVERALAELEAALSEADVSEERAGEDLLGEARELSAEIADRLDDARTGPDERPPSGRDTARESDRGSGGVTIEVTDDGADGDAREERPTVDVEAELDSIRDEVYGPGVDGDGGESADSESDGDEPDGDDAPGSE